MMKKAREDREMKVKKFKETVKQRLDEFINDDKQLRLDMEPMNKVTRSIV